MGRAHRRRTSLLWPFTIVESATQKGGGTDRADKGLECAGWRVVARAHRCRFACVCVSVRERGAGEGELHFWSSSSRQTRRPANDAPPTPTTRALLKSLLLRALTSRAEIHAHVHQTLRPLTSSPYLLLPSSRTSTTPPPTFTFKQRAPPPSSLPLLLLLRDRTMASPPPPPPSVRFLQLKDVFHRAVTLGIDCLDKEVSQAAEGSFET